MVVDQQRNPAIKTDDPHDEDAMVGSHNLILHAFQPNSDGGDTEERHSKGGIIGSSRSETLNHCSVDERDVGEEEKRGPDAVRPGHVLGMAVWDVLHPHAMAYKQNKSDFSSSSLLFPS